MRSFSAQDKMGKTRRVGRKGKRGGKVVTRRSGRVQRGGQSNPSAQQALQNVQTAMAQLASALNKGGVDTPVAEATGVVDNVEASPMSTPDATSIEIPSATDQTGGKRKTKKGGKKRKLNGFMKFANTRRAVLMKANPGAKIGDIGKMMGAEWRNLTEDAKKAFA